MSLKNLVTQGELAKTIETLGVLAQNLNSHVNDGMSKAHGWTGMSQTYQDSGGCYHSGSSNPGAPQRVVRIVVDGQIFYAPAQPSGGIDGAADPVPNPSSGVVSPQQADPALDLTTGSPTQDSLVTSFAPQLGLVSASANSGLLAHAGSSPEAVHGGLSAQAAPKIDTAGHTVGRSSVCLTVNGVQWCIVCDTDMRGPPQPTRFSGYPQVIAYRLNGGSFRLSSPGTWFDHAPPGADQSYYVAQVLIQGTPPIAYKWQYSKDNITWTDVNQVGQRYSANKGFTFNTIASGYNPGGTYYVWNGSVFVTATAPNPTQWIVAPLAGTITADPSQSTALGISIKNNGSSDNHFRL